MTTPIHDGWHVRKMGNTFQVVTNKGGDVVESFKKRGDAIDKLYKMMMQAKKEGSK